MAVRITKTLGMVIALNLVIIGMEVIFSKRSGSVALLSDALHNTGDISALLLALAAATIAEKNANWNKTFGYRRAEVIAAEVNSILILFMAVYIVYESINKILSSHPVEGYVVMYVAALALGANLLSAAVLRKGAVENINQRGAYLHMLADAGTSFAVLIGGFLSYFFEFYIADPVVGFGVAMVIFYGGYHLLKDTLHILMEGTPEVDVEKIRERILQESGVKDFHGIRCWKVSDKDTYFLGHLIVNTTSFEKATALRHKVERLIRDEGINNVTIQLEYPTEKTSEGKGNVL